MGLNEKQLSRIRAIAHGVVSSANQRTPWGFAVEVKRADPGAHLRITLRGGSRPSDPLMELGDLADDIRNEMRLAKTSLGYPVYGTSESVFESGNDPVFEFDVWLLE
jgi:hypothetical protein